MQGVAETATAEAAEAAAEEPMEPVREFMYKYNQNQTQNWYQKNETEDDEILYALVALPPPSLPC